MKRSAHQILSDTKYLMLERQIASQYSSDTLVTSIKYCSTDLYKSYIVYNPVDVRWHILIDIMLRVFK